MYVNDISHHESADRIEGRYHRVVAKKMTQEGPGFACFFWKRYGIGGADHVQQLSMVNAGNVIQNKGIVLLPSLVGQLNATRQGFYGVKRRMAIAKHAARQSAGRHVDTLLLKTDIKPQQPSRRACRCFRR